MLLMDRGGVSGWIGCRVVGLKGACCAVMWLRFGAYCQDGEKRCAA